MFGVVVAEISMRLLIIMFKVWLKWLHFCHPQHKMILIWNNRWLAICCSLRPANWSIAWDFNLTCFDGLSQMGLKALFRWSGGEPLLTLINLFPKELTRLGPSTCGPVGFLEGGWGVNLGICHLRHTVLSLIVSLGCCSCCWWLYKGFSNTGTWLSSSSPLLLSIMCLSRVPSGLPEVTEE